LDNESPDWNLRGGTVALEVHDPLISIKDLKSQLGEAHCGGMPENKIQLKSATLGFLKERLSLAHYNIKSGETIEVLRKKR
jgi:hypothetical protein